MAEYDPKGHGKEKTVESIRFVEAEPPAHLSEIVHRYLKLRTDEPLAEDYRFHALPDACTYMIFNQLEPEIVGVTGLRAASEELNLGTKFHYVNIRFFPGVWRFNREQLSHGQVADPYSGELPLVDVNRRLMGLAFDSQQSILSEFVEYLVEEKVVMANPVTRRIMQSLDDINSVADMARISHISPRQLQRILKRATGFAPHDFFKVLRLQKALAGDPTGLYSDQSHFIRSFRVATGYTPGRYAKNMMSEISNTCQIDSRKLQSSKHIEARTSI